MQTRSSFNVKFMEIDIDVIDTCCIPWERSEDLKIFSRYTLRGGNIGQDIPERGNSIEGRRKENVCKLSWSRWGGEGGEEKYNTDCLSVSQGSRLGRTDCLESRGRNSTTTTTTNSLHSPAVHLSSPYFLISQVAPLTPTAQQLVPHNYFLSVGDWRVVGLVSEQSN